MNKIRLTLIAIAFLISNIATSQTFHAIIIADTKDKDIGKSVKKDYYNMKIEFELIAKANNMNLNLLDDCIWDDFNKENAEKTLRELKCSPHDVVFFYYSGHGGRSYNDASPFPQLSLGSSDKELMALHAIDEIIAKKKPKLRIIMADCCNSYTAGITPKGDLGNKSILGDKPETNYKSLFGKLSGSIVVASSKAGETSSALNVGGAFTFSFLKELQKMIVGNNNAEWKTLLEGTKQATKTLAGHTPVFSVNVQIAEVPPPPPAVAPPIPPFKAALAELINSKFDEDYRIKRIQPTLNTFFASPNAIVKIYGRNGTLLSRETAEEFLERIATTHNLIGFVERDFQKAENGKYTDISLHEIYSK